MAVLATLMIPDQLRLVPIFVKFSEWHLLGHYHAYVLIKLASAAQLFLMRQYFLTIPRDLEEAAKLDGAGYFKTYRKVMLPLAGPALAAVGILMFQGTWNALFWPAILLQDRSQFTIPIGIANFRFAYTTLWPPLMAASVLAIVPILLLFVVPFCAHAGTWAWPLAATSLYLLLAFGLFQLALWPLVVFETDCPLRALARDAALALLRRPAGFAGLALALLLVNVVGVAAAILPFLTLTMAYSFLVSAHFALPKNPTREV